MIFSATDHGFMARALQLAQRGLFTATPNPRVGCVMVRDGRVLGEGWHEKAGGPHAEAAALNGIVGAGETAIGATAYVTLEPCSHFGRTPPCADALIAAGVVRVVAAMPDPNPLVAGQGLAKLAGALLRGADRHRYCEGRQPAAHRARSFDDAPAAEGGDRQPARNAARCGRA
jgi:diaminohydroxyphosphoribosylaminopyrimidine deaminase/5-amino-6-(5-phosphoribosylamino)uracil reductase